MRPLYDLYPPKRKPRLILALTLIATGMFALEPRSPSHAQTPDTKLRVTNLIVKSTVLLPAICDGKLMPSGFKDNGRVRVTVESNTDIPLNYIYDVSGGRIIGAGPTVVWDLNDGYVPGEYSVTVRIDDGIGNRSEPVTKRVTLAEPEINCPCECPSIEIRSHTGEVRPGQVAEFEARALGGKQKEELTYTWTAQNGTIRSGQGTASIEVIATGRRGSEVTGTVQIVGTDPSCNCPVTSSASVPIGRRTIAQSYSARVDSLSLDESTVYLECQAGHRARPGSPRSEDMLVEVTTSARGNTVHDRLTYDYSVTGGVIVGSGTTVEWDVSGLAPGTYEISVGVDAGSGPSPKKKRTVTVIERDCVWDQVECPAVSLSRPLRIGASDDYIVRAASQGFVAEDTQFRWVVSNGTIIAGQGSKSVRVRARGRAGDPVPSVSFVLALPDAVDSCPKEWSVVLQTGPAQ
jgi:hypothetical protein